MTTEGNAASDGLREALTTALHGYLGSVIEVDVCESAADALLALPELAALRAKAAAVDRAHEALDALSRETGAYEAGYKGWAQTVIRNIRRALDGDPGRC